jgi:hypothetical protein
MSSKLFTRYFILICFYAFQIEVPYEDHVTKSMPVVTSFNHEALRGEDENTVD